MFKIIAPKVLLRSSYYVFRLFFIWSHVPFQFLSIAYGCYLCFLARLTIFLVFSKNQNLASFVISYGCFLFHLFLFLSFTFSSSDFLWVYPAVLLLASCVECLAYWFSAFLSHRSPPNILVYGISIIILFWAYSKIHYVLLLSMNYLKTVFLVCFFVFLSF